MSDPEHWSSVVCHSQTGVSRLIFVAQSWPLRSSTPLPMAAARGGNALMSMTKTIRANVTKALLDTLTGPGEDIQSPLIERASGNRRGEESAEAGRG